MEHERSAADGRLSGWPTRLLAGAVLAAYAAALLAFSVIAFQRDRAIAPEHDEKPGVVALGPTTAHRVDHGAFLDAGSLAESLVHRPFLPADGTRPNVGLLIFEGGYLWLSHRLSLPLGGGDDWVIWIDDRFARDARLILAGSDGATTTHDWHYFDTGNPGLARRTHPVFHLDRDEIAGKTAYVALSSYGGLKGDLFVAPLGAFEATFERRFILLSMINGAVAAIGVFLGAIGLRLREPAFLHAAGMSLFLMIRNLAETGAHRSVLLPSHPAMADVLIYGTQPVAMAFWLLFTLAFLDIREKAPRLHRAANWLALVLPLQGLLIVLKGGFFPEMPFNTSAAIPTFAAIIVGFGILFWQVWAGSRRALWFMLCWSPIALGLVLRMSSYLVPTWTADLGILSRQGADLVTSLVALAILLTVDLRERERRLVRAARRNEQKARDFAEIGGDAMLEVGPDGIIRSADGELARRIGIGIGMPLEQAINGMTATMREEMNVRPVKGLEFAGNQAGGPDLHFSVNSLPAADVESGLPDGFRAVLSDISEQVRNRQTEARRNTLAALGHLAGGIAHEVNNLLHPIISLSKRVAERHVDDADGKRLLGLVVTSGIRAGEIVRSVLRAYTPDGFAGPPVTLDVAVRDSIDTIRVTLPSGIDLETFIEPSLSARVRTGEMIQVLSNLASNSVRAMSGAGRLSVRLVNDAGRPTLVVADNGPGMAEDVRRRATDAFVTGRADGIGLGLSMVQRIAASWEAELDIQSSPETGTTVRILFPARTDAKDDAR